MAGRKSMYWYTKLVTPWTDNNLTPMELRFS